MIYSENDHLCQKVHYDILHKALADRENIEFILVDNKGHNPNYTEAAVALLSEFTKARTRLLKKKNLSEEEKARFVAGFDWHKMTEQDESLWEKILAHLEK